MQTILVCDDDKQIVEAINIYLTGEGFEVIKAYDGYEALEYLEDHEVNLMIVDVMMPGLDGIRTTLKVRETSSIPIIILSAKSEDTDKILGLNIGADDYITKPFSMRELVARVGANIRRTAMAVPSGTSAAANAMPVSGDLSINTDSHQVFRAGKAIDLTQREYELLTFLASHPNKVYSRTDLMEQVWNYGYVGDDVRTVDVTVRRLREKIEADPANPAYILTRRGAGYYFAV